MKIVFIVNSRSKFLKSFLKDLDKAAKNYTGQYSIYFTEYQAHAIDLAKREAPLNDLLIAVGGDGTLNEVLNGIMLAGLSSAKRPALTLVPLGTANDFALVQNITRNLDVVMRATKDSFTQIDIGEMRTENKTLKAPYFINIGDAGLGAEVIRYVIDQSESLSYLSLGMLYFFSIFRTFFKYRHQSAEVHFDGGSRKTKFLSIIVANSKALGGGMYVAPKADPRSGKFQLVLIGGVSIVSYLLNLGKIKKGKRLTHPKVSYHETSKVRIVAGEMLFTEADGQLVSNGNIEMECLPGAIRFLLPNG